MFGELHTMATEHNYTANLRSIYYTRFDLNSPISTLLSL